MEQTENGGLAAGEALAASAARGGPMPENLSLVEQLAWQALAHLYARARLGQVRKEAGAREKRTILHALRTQRQEEDIQTRLAFWRAELLRETEAARAAYSKDRTLENADRLSALLEGRVWNGALTGSPEFIQER